MNRHSQKVTNGKIRMIDIGGKKTTERSATASVTLVLNHDIYNAVKEGRGPKGDVFEVAKLAGIQAAKKTSELIPLCHHIALDLVEIDFELDDRNSRILIESTVNCSARTGVEMEALTACSIAALTIYDMLKGVQEDICITDLVLLRKSGGKSGVYQNKNI